MFSIGVKLTRIHLTTKGTTSDVDPYQASRQRLMGTGLQVYAADELGKDAGHGLKQHQMELDSAATTIYTEMPFVAILRTCAWKERCAFASKYQVKQRDHVAVVSVILLSIVLASASKQTGSTTDTNVQYQPTVTSTVAKNVGDRLVDRRLVRRQLDDVNGAMPKLMSHSQSFHKDLLADVSTQLPFIRSLVNTLFQHRWSRSV